jgi:hypothetical protein
MKKTILFIIIALFAVSLAAAQDGFQPCTGSLISSCSELSEDNCPDSYMIAEGIRQCHWTDGGCYPDGSYMCAPECSGNYVPDCTALSENDCIPRFTADDNSLTQYAQCTTSMSGDCYPNLNQYCEPTVDKGNSIPEFSPTAIIAIIAIIVVAAFVFVRKK